MAEDLAGNEVAGPQQPGWERPRQSGQDRLVAPGEQVSGLEDEYALAGSRPKLVYIKTPAPKREARLKARVMPFRWM